MKEPAEWLDHQISVLAETAKDAAVRCRALVGEVHRHTSDLHCSRGSLDTEPMHARRLVHDVQTHLLPSLDHLAHVTDLQKLRARICCDDASSRSSYGKAVELRTRRLKSKHTQVIDTDHLVGLLEVCGKGLSDVRSWMSSSPPSLAAAARSGSLGKTKAGRVMSDALQDQLFHWSVQREARVLADNEISIAVSATTGSVIDGALTAPPTAGHLRKLVAAQTTERSLLQSRIEEERQSLINEQAFVDNLLRDVETLEGVLDAVHAKADAAQDVLRNSFYKLEAAVAKESDRTLIELEAERDRLLRSVSDAKAAVAEFQESLDREYQQHPAHSQIVHLRQHHLRPTLSMLKFAFDERRKSAGAPQVKLSLADEVNDPLARLWLRGDLPDSATMPTVLVLHDMDSGAFLQCARAAHGASVVPLDNVNGRFKVQSAHADAHVTVTFMAS
jgi:hypothetical protein